MHRINGRTATYLFGIFVAIAMYGISLLNEHVSENAAYIGTAVLIAAVIGFIVKVSSNWKKNDKDESKSS